MKIAIVKTIGVAAAILGMALVSTAAAVSVSYTVGGGGPMQFPGPVTPPENAPWGPDGYPGDIVEIQPYTGTFDLTPGTHVQKINTLLWTIDYTYGGTETDPGAWSDLYFALDAPRSMSMHTSNGALDQTGLLRVTWFNDYISFALGSTTSFTVLGYTVYVTPLAIGSIQGLPGKLSIQSPGDMSSSLIFRISTLR